MYDIIPDIHGQANKLKVALANLGYCYRNGAWRNSDPNRLCVFLGDYIDRGPNNAEAIDIVRRMIDAGTAHAIMGNHELNAIHFHMKDNGGKPLREHSEKNLGQHASFLREFPLGGDKTAAAISWMKTLPLFLELDDFRVVHACWNEATIRELDQLIKDGCLSNEQFLDAADQKSLCMAKENTKLFHLVETTTKGPEEQLPHGHIIYDKQGFGRTDVRLQWWNGSASTWRDIAISVPDPTQLPMEKLPASVKQTIYPTFAKPVFFGHYWMTGAPVLQAPNALCLDYSAGTDGPLVTYTFEAGSLELANLNSHDG